MPFTRIARFDDLSAGEPHPFRIADQELVLCRIEDAVYAVDGRCPHVGGPLGHGTLHGRMLVCPWHGWEFDCTTGQHDRLSTCHLATFPVAIQDGEVLVDLNA